MGRNALEHLRKQCIEVKTQLHDLNRVLSRPGADPSVDDFGRLQQLKTQYAKLDRRLRLMSGNS